MKLKTFALVSMSTLVVFLPLSAAAEENGYKKGKTPVTTGIYIRGVTLAGQGKAGAPTGKTCDFSRESLKEGRLEDASVNCKPGGNIKETLLGLPDRFNAYCLLPAPGKGGNIRVIQASLPENSNHCSLSGITPKTATRQFRGSVWRHSED